MPAKKLICIPKRLFVKGILNPGVWWLRRQYLSIADKILNVRRNPPILNTLGVLIFVLQTLSKMMINLLTVLWSFYCNYLV